jgi:radical SAM superfamily enzyme YgiQ (UPF0313 family)
MIGSPTETVDDIMMTKEFIKKSGLDAFSVAITTPFPGTKLWEMCKEKGLIPEKVDWKLFNGGFQLTFPMSEIPNDELLRLYKELTNLSLGYNLRMDASSLFSYVYKHPLKVIKKVLTNPKSVYIVFKKVFLKKNK